jgi:large subunit ribosomal protein L22
MGARKRNRANERKEQNKEKYYAVLRNVPSSPQKMRLAADLVRGLEVNRALDVLKYSNKSASEDIEKLLMSAIANWQQKNEGVRIEDSHLVVKEIFVNEGRTLKRLQTAPQGRAYRVRKRSNHVTLVIDNETTVEEQK